MSESTTQSSGEPASNAKSSACRRATMQEIRSVGKSNILFGSLEPVRLYPAPHELIRGLGGHWLVARSQEAPRLQRPSERSAGRPWLSTTSVSICRPAAVCLSHCMAVSQISLAPEQCLKVAGGSLSHPRVRTYEHSLRASHICSPPTPPPPRSCSAPLQPPPCSCPHLQRANRVALLHDAGARRFHERRQPVHLVVGGVPPAHACHECVDRVMRAAQLLRVALLRLHQRRNARLELAARTGRSSKLSAVVWAGGSNTPHVHLAGATAKGGAVDARSQRPVGSECGRGQHVRLASWIQNACQ
eukprot:365312-Chlamydomonas_euryale.AAC.5